MLDHHLNVVSELHQTLQDEGPGLGDWESHSNVDTYRQAKQNMCAILLLLHAKCTHVFLIVHVARLERVCGD